MIRTKPSLALPTTRRAFSVLEAIIAMVLLTAATGVVGRFMFEVQKGLQERELASCFTREVENATERIRSWNTSEVTVMQIESMPFSDVISSRVEEPRWRAKVTPIANPIDALEVEIRIECRLYEQLATPERLTFWIAREGDADAE